MLDFSVPVAQLELLADLLWSLGVVAIEEREATDGFVTLRTSMGDDFAGVCEQILAIYSEVTITTCQIDKAISDTWRTHALPTWITQNVVLCPAWLVSPVAQHSIYIEPADTFGLGNHPTTVLALRLGLRHCEKHARVFDFGCGSGVLGISLAKILECESLVFDIANHCESVVEINNRLNETHVSWHTDITNITVDFVFANILAPVLIAESSVIIGATKSDGRIVLSGMRDEQVLSVLNAFNTCKEIDRESIDGWTAVVLQKL